MAYAEGDVASLFFRPVSKSWEKAYGKVYAKSDHTTSITQMMTSRRRLLCAIGAGWDGGAMACKLAAATGDWVTFEIVCRLSALNGVRPASGSLRAAVGAGKVETVVALTEHGYLLDRVDRFALVHAVESGSVEMVDAVLAAMRLAAPEEFPEVDGVTVFGWFGEMVARGFRRAIRLGYLQPLEMIYAEFEPRFRLGRFGETLRLLAIKVACRYPQFAPLEWCVKRCLFDADSMGEVNVEMINLIVDSFPLSRPVVGWLWVTSLHGQFPVWPEEWSDEETSRSLCWCTCGCLELREDCFYFAL